LCPVADAEEGKPGTPSWVRNQGREFYFP
jgi:hypothetical protein